MIRLFDIPEQPEPDELSAGAKQTARRRDLLESGINPATGLPVKDGADRCRDCDWFYRYSNYHRQNISMRCGYAEQGARRAVTARAGWPACTAFKEKEEGDE